MKSRSAPSYAELQVTTNFSFLRGGSHPHELVAQASALGLSAIAVTDRNTLAGVVRAHLAAKKVGLRLIVGARLDLEDGPSLLCLPTDRQAYGRLCRMLSDGQLRSDKGKCRLFLADVAAHAEGQIFIALPPADWDWQETSKRPAESKKYSTAEIVQFPVRFTAGAGSSSLRAGKIPDSRARLAASGNAREGDGYPKFPLPSMGRGQGWGEELGDTSAKMNDALNPTRHGEEGRSEAFEKQLRRLKRMVGSAPLYLAASYLYRGDDRARIAALATLAERCGTPLVATGDILYHAPHRRPLADVLTCVREGITIREAGFKLPANAERHLKTPAEMARLFRGHEAALARTIEIAEACRFSLDELRYEYPDEPVPPGKTAQSHLEDLTWEGARWRYPDGIPEKIAETLRKELALIAELEYAPYFLTVHDIVHFARSQSILAQGRGSAANSAVCYCLAITAVNPVDIDLLFERFVSRERKEPPDIDVDFEHERREEVIQYIYARYGRDRAGIAATVISYRARSAVREVGKAMGLSEDTVAALAGMVWGISGGALPEKHVREAGLDPRDPLLATVIELTAELIGFPRHLSQHVGGFVLTRGPLCEVVPIGNAAMEKRTFIEWDKDDLDALGLLKVDVLGLGMLTCIRKAFALIEQHHGKRYTLATVPPDDEAVYDMLCRADSIGVFQVESRAQMNMLPRLKPRCFYDLVIEVAIVRPGPIQGDMVHPYLRRRDRIEPEYYPSPSPEHGHKDELKKVLGKTKGVPLFQEQAMRIAQVAAQFSDAEVNDLRRAMATFRRVGTIGLLEEKMVSRMVARGYDAEFAARCFSQIKGFGEYGFPESHAASFALLVYVSSWIKCHYPAAFACALLNSQPMGFYAPAQIVRDAREHGVEAREVDVNHSDWDCTLEPSEDCSTKFPLPSMGRGQGWGEELGETPLAGAHTFSLKPSLPDRLPTPPRQGEWGKKAGDGSPPALRLGMRQIAGINEDDAKKLVAVRGYPPPLRLPGSRASGAPIRDLSHLREGENGNPRRTQSVPLNSRHSKFTAIKGDAGSSSLRAGKIPDSRARRAASGNAEGEVGSETRSAVEAGSFVSRPNGDCPNYSNYGETGRWTGFDEAQTLLSPPTIGGNYRDVHDLWVRAGIKLVTLEKLAAADAFRSMGLDRRQALWEVRALAAAEPLPLFAWGEARETAAEPDVALPEMRLSEHVVNDYQTLRLSLKAHPMSFLRKRLEVHKILSCAGLRACRDGQWVAVAGVVLVRQRPGSASGVVFMTIEDETGVANAVVWPNMLERYRKVVMGARLIVIRGRIQRHEDIIHVVSAALQDESDWLKELSEYGPDLTVPIANADEVRRPELGSWRERIIPHKLEPIVPKSRDFH